MRTRIPAFLAVMLAGSAALVAISSQGRAQVRNEHAIPLSTEDRLAIEELIYQYAHFIDTRLPEAWASTFTADGRLEFVDPRASKDLVVVQGHDQLVAFVQKVAADQSFFSTHFIGNILLTQAAPGFVRARSMVIVARRANATSYTLPVVQGVGIYDDEIVKTSEGWRFKVRHTGNNGELPVRPEFLAVPPGGSAR